MIAIMSDDLFSSLAEMAVAHRSIPAGASLFCRGDRIASLFLVRTGEMHLRRILESGAELTLQRCTGPGLLAEASLFAAAYHCDGVAASACEVQSVPKAALLRRLNDDRRFSELWASHLAREVQQARFRSELLALKTVAERLDLWLAWADNRIPPKGQRRRLASELGVSPEALYRELARRDSCHVGARR